MAARQAGVIAALSPYVLSWELSGWMPMPFQPFRDGWRCKVNMSLTLKFNAQSVVEQRDVVEEERPRVEPVLVRLDHLGAGPGDELTEVEGQVVQRRDRGVRLLDDELSPRGRVGAAAVEPAKVRC